MPSGRRSEFAIDFLGSARCNPSRGRAMMSDHPNGNSTPGASAAPRDERVASSGQAASRRTVLKSGAGFVAGGLATPAPPDTAFAQDAPDAELSRLQGQRRILI